MISLRNIAMLWVTLLLIAISIAAVLASRALAVIEINKLLDNELQQIALNAGSGLYTGIHQLISHMEDENRISVQVWDDNGALIHENPMAMRLPQQPASGFHDLTFKGKSWRVYTASDGKHTTQAAQRWSARTEIANHTALAAAVPVLAALPIAWIAIVLGVNALLARFSRFANELAERGLEAKEPVLASGMPHEITPLISAMNELIARHKAAAEQQKQFLSDAAHELRTPLAALQIQIDNFHNQPSANARDAALGELKAGIQRATAMIRQLMRMARLDDGAPGSQTIDLRETLITVVSDFVRMASARNIDLEMEIDESASTEIADTEIRFLFTNLIDNAVRYSVAGGRVIVILRRSGPDILVEVRDYGIGIPVTALPRLYDRFYRAAPADIEGTGLGLAIARKIADRNGFGLDISNNIGGPGVSATVFIPQST